MCLSGEVETMEHLRTCPAMAHEQSALQVEVSDILRRFPFSTHIVQSFQSHQEKWLKDAKSPHFASISVARLKTLTEDFWKMNKHKEFIPHDSFSKSLRQVLTNPTRATTQIICPKLVSLLCSEFKIQVEGFTDALRHSVAFEHWCSSNPDDRAFGSLGNFFDMDLRGRNVFLCPEPQSLEEMFQRIETLVNATAPTRFLVLLPSHASHGFLTIASLTNCPVFSDHKTDLSLVLALNKESMLIDPIDWTSFVLRIQEWSPRVSIPALTNAMFQERKCSFFAPMRASMNDPKRQSSDCPLGLYSFHVPMSHPIDKKQLRICNIPTDAVAALAGINRHKFTLSALGILPNQFRKLLRPIMGDCDADLLHLRKCLFWGGYTIWKARKRLVARYWKSMEKAQQGNQQRDSSSCKSPFHFWTKVADLSKQRITRCPCSRVQPKQTSLIDIRLFLSTDSRICENIPVSNYNMSDGLDRKHIGKNLSMTSAEIVRNEHDRRKKRKLGV